MAISKDGLWTLGGGSDLWAPPLAPLQSQDPIYSLKHKLKLKISSSFSATLHIFNWIAS